MYKILSEQSSINEKLETLNSDGVFVIQDFLSEEQTILLKNEMVKKLNSSNKPYNFGKLWRGGSLKNYLDNDPIMNAFDRDWMKELSTLYHPNKPYGASLISTHDYVSTKKWERQGWLHFDKKNSLKYFIYLTDVSEGCGEFVITPKSHKLGYKLRNEWSDGEYESKRKLDDTLSEKLKSYTVTPVLENKGTLIVFDTDTFHKGGVVEEGRERLIVRLHNK